MTKETHKLTPRQLSVLKLVIWTNREIGVRLGISNQTVKNHWSDIFRALGVRSRCEAVLMALDAGLLVLGDFMVSVGKQPSRSWIGIGDPIPLNNYWKPNNTAGSLTISSETWQHRKISFH